MKNNYNEIDCVARQFLMFQAATYSQKIKKHKKNNRLIRLATGRPVFQINSSIEATIAREQPDTRCI
jgi:hypothetical protein